MAEGVDRGNVNGRDPEVGDGHLEAEADGVGGWPHEDLVAEGREGCDVEGERLVEERQGDCEADVGDGHVGRCWCDVGGSAIRGKEV